MIKVIIFDCFGVLVRSSLEAFIDRHFHDEAKIASIRHLDHLASKGKITWDEYLDKVGVLANMDHQSVKAELDQTPANEELFTYIENDLKPHYKIGMLSNAYADWLDDLFTPEQQQLFDDIVLSYRTGMAKPDPRIYRLSSTNFGVAAQECVFIDDIPQYCEAARSVGMKAICFHDVEQLRRDLDKILTSAK